MSIESQVVAILRARCPNKPHAVVAPHGSPLPRLVYQHVGGRTLRYMDNTAGGRNILMQVSAWDGRQDAAFALIRQIEDDLCAAPALQVTPQGEPMAGVADGEEVYGAIQVFSIYGERS